MLKPVLQAKMGLSIQELLVMRCCHACKQGISTGHGTFHTHAQIMSCASICDVCSAIAKNIPGQHPPTENARPSYCRGDYIFEVAHTEDWLQVAAPEEMEEGHNNIPYEVWKYVEALDGSGICTNCHEDHEIPEIETTGELILHTSLAEKMATMKLWLEDDVLYTKTAPTTPSFPTRCLDLRHISEYTSENKITLSGKVYLRESKISYVDTMGKESSRPPSNGRYVALSYRWPLKPHITTSTSNYRRFVEDGIDIQSFPPIFRDAVAVTRKLGLYYLWIDALCIIQDDEADWKSEAAIMGAIYTQAICTITVHHHSTNIPDNGFLHFITTPKVPGMEYTTSQLLEDFDELVGFSELSKRGWIMQERVLSPRIIHFTTTGDGRTFWESRRTGTFEYTTTIDFIRRQSVSDISLCTFTQYWFDLVERFSECELTYEDDKLYAIAGIAQHVQGKINIMFKEGLWENSFYCGLLWLARDDALRIPEKERAPSWTWAARDGEVVFPWKYAFGRLPVGWEEGLIQTPSWVPSLGAEQKFDIEGLSLGMLDSGIEGLSLDTGIIRFSTKLTRIGLPEEIYKRRETEELDEDGDEDGDEEPDGEEPGEEGLGEEELDEQRTDEDDPLLHSTVRQLEFMNVNMSSSGCFHAINDEEGDELGWVSLDDGYCTSETHTDVWIAHIATLHYMLAGIEEDDQTSLCCLLLVESGCGGGEMGYSRIGAGVIYDVKYFDNEVTRQIKLV